MKKLKLFQDEEDEDKKVNDITPFKLIFNTNNNIKILKEMNEI